MFSKTQVQIEQSWKTKKPCLVSVVVVTYNHELYIREAIESILMQETDFPFEIIIHDDASTDNTTSIIREFHARFPNIIKPVIQKENQYSKGGFKPSIYAAGCATGKYIALCDGDDCWINKHKLQIQVEAMLAHREVEFSFHPAYLKKDGIVSDKPHWCYSNENRVFNPGAILSVPGQFAPTSSYMFQRDVFKRLPEYINEVPVGDFFLEMYGAQRGGALYIAKTMSVYRVSSVNSWTSNISENQNARIKHHKKMIFSLEKLKTDFPGCLNSLGHKMASSHCLLARSYLINRDYDSFKQEIVKSVITQAGLSYRQMIMYKLRFTPRLLRHVMMIYKSISKSIKRHSVQP
jgi:glycosyltransferase involved in cell wall biosynthesis